MISFYKNIVTVVLLFLLSIGNAYAQYKYTRFAFDVNGGFSMPNTSITGTAGGYSEIGFKLAPSRFLAGRLAIGVGTLTGSQQVDIITGKVEVISEQRDAVKTDIKESENDLQVLEQAKDAIKTEKPKTAKQAKENILSKTNKNKK
jgi:hypothetical protein